ncbi:MAG: ankyrin repeat domain-containing protein [Candidatus Micrarchaeia archaeon]
MNKSDKKIEPSKKKQEADNSLIRKLNKLGVDVEGIQKEAESQKARATLSPVERRMLSWELLKAAKSGDLARIKELLNMGADVNAKDNDGETPAHWATRNGHLEPLKVLIENGADVNAKDNDGWTPAHWATRNGHLEPLKVLIENGADVNSKDKYDWTPFDLAKTDEIKQILKEAMEKKVKSY